MLSRKFMAIMAACTMVVPNVMTSFAPVMAAETTYGNLVDESFENGLNGWGPRGPETVEVTTEEAHTGVSSVKISDRKSTWNGVSCDMTELLTKGETYTFGVWIKYTDNSAAWQQNFSLQLQYNDGVSDNYKTIKTSAVTRGNWTYLEGEYTIPTDSENVCVYIESQYKSSPSSQDLVTFYVDDFTATPASLPEIEQNLVNLKDVYSTYFKIGGAAMASDIAPKPGKDLFLKHYNSLTFGNELKPDSVLDYDATVAYVEEGNEDAEVNPQVSLRAARTLLEFARDNDLPVRGHTLVWHNQTPDWFFKENYSKDDNAPWASKEVMLQRMENYIKNVMAALEEQYPEVEFYAWDVVNEAVDPNTSTGMRNPGSNYKVSGQSAWMQTVGEEYIEKAFEYARKYAPEGCKLFYNDYNEYETKKMNYIYDILKDLKEKDLIDGMGMQSHWVMQYPSISMFETAVKKYASLGLEIQLTELDIANTDNGSYALQTQANRYKAILDKTMELKKAGCDITAVVFWGVTDTTSWLGGYPLLFDGEYKAKPAFYAITENVAPLETAEPTVAPTVEPTATVAPTVVPTTTPVPTVEPTTTPVPTTEPTVEPTVAPTVAPTVTPVEGAPTVEVRTNENGNSIGQRYTINVAEGTIDISKIKIVYKADGMGSEKQNVWCDNAALQLNIDPWYTSLTNAVKGEVVDGMLTLTFDTDATFTAGTGQFVMDVRVAKEDWSRYDQLSNEAVEVYYDGVRVQ